MGFFITSKIRYLFIYSLKFISLNHKQDVTRSRVCFRYYPFYSILVDYCWITRLKVNKWLIKEEKPAINCTLMWNYGSLMPEKLRLTKVEICLNAGIWSQKHCLQWKQTALGGVFSDNDDEAHIRCCFNNSVLSPVPLSW